MKLKYTFLGFLLFVGLLFIPRNINAKDNEVNNKIVGNIERENNKTAKYITLKNVKKHIEKVGEEELFEQAKLEIENRYKSNSLIRVMGTGGSSYGPGEHSTGVVYMGEGGMLGYTILNGRMRILDVYIPKEEALRVAKGGIFSHGFSEKIGSFFGSVYANYYANTGVSALLVLKYLYGLSAEYHKYIEEEVKKNDISVYIQTIEDSKEGGITHHLVPWQNCPFVDVKDKDSLVIFSK